MTVILLISGLTLLVFLIWDHRRVRKNIDMLSRVTEERLLRIAENSGALQSLSIDEISIIERDIKGLRKVIVICDRLEKPTGELFNAVVDNLQENAIYHFIVSDAYYEEAKDKYSGFFGGISETLSAITGKPKSHYQSMFRLSSIGYTRSDVPFIFYEHEDSGRRRVVGFSGNEVGTGIAEKYTAIPSALAYTIYSSCLHSIHLAKTLVKYTKDEFESMDDNYRENVLEFSPKEVKL